MPLNPDEIDLTFEIPNREWSGRLTRPTVNCFLYDIRENQRLRAAGWDVRTNPTTRSGGRSRGPLRFDATYQITAWARAREDEHRLLWRTLAALVRHPLLPADVLQGGLQEQPMPMPTSVAQAEQMPANIGDLWQGLDNPIHPSLTYVVTLALDPAMTVTSPLVLRAPVFQLQQIGDGSLTVAGRVADRENTATPVVGALVLLLETGGRAFTGDDGTFAIPNAPRGRATLRVYSEGRDTQDTVVDIPGPSVELLV